MFGGVPFDKKRGQPATNRGKKSDLLGWCPKKVGPY